jgi:Glycosyl transferase family 2
MQPLVVAALEAIVLFLLLAGAASFAIMVKGTLVLRRMARECPLEDNATLLKSPLVPAVSVIAAPPDSSHQSRALVRLLVGLHFGNHEVVLALDGPDDADLTAWSDDFHLAKSPRRIDGALPMGNVRSVLESRDPIRLTVIVLERCTPSAALNAAANAARSPIIGLFGPDCEFAPEALLRLIPPMLAEPRRTIAVCGVAPAPTEPGLLSQFASLDILRAWLGRQAALSAWNLLIPAPGSAMLIARDSILKAGGFRAGPLELILRLHANVRASNQADRVAFAPASCCYQRAARSLAELRGGVLRDQQSMASAMRMSALPWWLRSGILALCFLRPLLETVAYILTIVGLAEGWVARPLLFLVLLSTVGLGMLLSMAAVSLRELAEYHGSDPSRLARLFFAAIPENLGFQQLKNLWLLLAPWAIVLRGPSV